MLATLPDPVCDMPAVLAGRYAYLFGGYVAPLHTSDKIVRYDLLTDTITVMGAKRATYAYPVYSMSAVWDGNYAYLFGGYDGYSYFDHILRYDPIQDQLTTMGAKLPTGLKWSAAIWTGTYAYLFGGYTPSGLTDMILRYSPATDSIQVMSARMPMPIDVPSAVWTGEYVYLFGGGINIGGRSDQISKYDPALDSLTLLGETLPSPRCSTSAVWDGHNAYVFGGEGYGTSLDEIVKFSPVRAPTKWAVVLGVNEYPNPNDNGHGGPVNSANDMYNLLVNKFNFPASNVHLKTDTVGNSADDIKKANITNELNWLIKNALPGDTAVFYYAGHGDQISTGTEFLVPHDEGNLISDTELALYINNITATNLLVILDMSFSGGFITDGQTLWQGILGIVPSWTNLAEGTPSGRIVLTACAENVGPKLGNRYLRDAVEFPYWYANIGTRYEMVFTHLLTMGFYGEGDSNSDGKVTVEEAFRFAQRRAMVVQTPLMYDGYPANGSSGDLYLG